MNVFVIPLLAELGDAPSVDELVDSSESLLIGFFFVILLLGTLAVMTSLLGKLFVRQEAAAKAKTEAAAAAMAAAAPPVVAAAPVVVEEDPDAHLLPVIAAAIHTVFGDRPHRVVAIRPASSGWAQEGRREIFSGRRVR